MRRFLVLGLATLAPLLAVGASGQGAAALLAVGASGQLAAAKAPTFKKAPTLTRT